MIELPDWLAEAFEEEGHAYLYICREHNVRLAMWLAPGADLDAAGQVLHEAVLAVR